MRHAITALTLAASLAVGSLFPAATAQAQEASGLAQSTPALTDMSAEGREKLRIEIRAYLLEHPELLSEVIAVLQARQKADRAAQTISNELRNAFTLAARQRKPVRIVLNTSDRSLRITDRSTGTTLVRRDFSHQNSAFGLTSMTVSDATIDVFPNGVASDSLAIRFGVATNSRVVRMTRVGHVRVQ